MGPAEAPFDAASLSPRALKDALPALSRKQMAIFDWSLSFVVTGSDSCASPRISRAAFTYLPTTGHREALIIWFPLAMADQSLNGGFRLDVPTTPQGAYAVLQTAWSLNSLFKASIKAVAILPVMVDKRLAMTDLIYQSIDTLSKEQSLPILHSIRVDSTVQKATRSKTFLQDFDPKCKAVEDYRTATEQLLAHLKGQLDGKQLALAETR
jgi:hypothetical protein